MTLSEDAPLGEGEIWISEQEVHAFMASIEDGSMDGCLTDLPYSSTERYRMIGTTTRTAVSTKSSNAWYPTMSIPQLSHVLDLIYDKLKPDAYAFIYVDDDTKVMLQHHRGVLDDLARLNDIDKLRDGTLKPTSRASRDTTGFAWWGALSWVKVAQADDGLEALEDTKLAPGNGFHGRKCHERILCLEKGKSQLRVSLNDVQLASRPSAPAGATIKKRGSPKPIIIAERLARAMSAPGGTILEPFLGSGTHAIGVTRAGCDIVANDIDMSHARDWIGAMGRSTVDW